MITITMTTEQFKSVALWKGHEFTMGNMNVKVVGITRYPDGHYEIDARLLK